MHKSIAWVWPLLGILACDGDDAPPGDTSGETEACGTSGHDPTAATQGESSESHAEGSDPTSTESSEGGEETSEGSSEGASRCGDDTCDADEDEASCCTDCGCAQGSSCVEATCTPDPFCGDAACNGAETTEDCCVDCGCAEGSACQDDACVVLPVCGDGTCNGTETMDDCCDDCGCGENYTCEANACACTGAYVHFENILPDADQYCFATDSFYTQESTAYLNIGAGWQYLEDGDFVDAPGPLDTTVDGTLQCCYIDTCSGTLTCPTPFGSYPCFCADPVPVSGSLDVCGENFVGVCG